MLKQRLKLLILVLFALFFGLSIKSLIAAWYSPSFAPPVPNIAAPINVSVQKQAKTGIFDTEGGLVIEHRPDDPVGADVGRIWLVTAVQNCLGSVPLNAIKLGADNYTTSNATWHYNNANTSAECEFECDSGYVWSGGNCVAASYSWVNSGTEACQELAWNDCRQYDTYVCERDSDGQVVNDSYCVSSKPSTYAVCGGSFQELTNDSMVHSGIGYNCSNFGFDFATACNGKCQDNVYTKPCGLFTDDDNVWTTEPNHCAATGKACKCQMPCDIREHCLGSVVEYFNCENKCDDSTIWGTISGVWWPSPYDVH